MTQISLLGIYMPKRNQNMFQQNLHMDIDSRITQNRQKVETGQVSINKGKGKYNVVYLSNGILFGNKKK